MVYLSPYCLSHLVQHKNLNTIIVNMQLHVPMLTKDSLIPPLIIETDTLEAYGRLSLSYGNDHLYFLKYDMFMCDGEFLDG